MELFKVLDQDGVKKFQEWGESHSPSESWSWETLHPVIRAVWHKNYRLCMVCGKPPKDQDSVCLREHRNAEPPKVLLLSYLTAGFPHDNAEELAKRCVWYPSEGFWGISNYCGMFVGIEVDGYVHS